MTKKAAIIGAGLAGLSCARTLRRAGFSVEVFEREKVIGGRLSTVRLNGETFDHGAQYVSARLPEFRQYLSEVGSLGYAAEWSPRATVNGRRGAQTQSWYVGTPGMSSIVRPLTESVRIATGKAVHSLERRDKSWHVWFEDETSAGPYHAVGVAVPAGTAQLLLGRFNDLVAPLSRVRMTPCWSLMVRVEQHVLPEEDVFSDVSSVIRWVARNNAKPGRSPEGDNIVIQAGPVWSRENEDADPSMVAEELWNEASHTLGLPPVRPSHTMAHLWRYGLVDQSLGETCIYSNELRAGLAGDWCLGRLAEHAFESGDRLGRAISSSLS